MNKLFYGDNLEILRQKIDRETIDLCYIDPPFNSKRTYNQIYNNIGKEDKAQAQAFIDTWRWDDRAVDGFNQIRGNHNNAFTKQSIQLISGLEKVLGKGDLLAYLISMTLRIAEIHRVLKKTGSLYLHCDPTASHYLKLIIDAIFCSQGGDFINEIVWCYTSGGKSKNHFARKHDIIFFYSKSHKYNFNVDAIRVPYSEKTLANYKPGLIGSTYTSEVKLNKNGKVPEDYWNIAIASKSTKEYLGYPTQKPEALLQRIIEGSTNKDDIILDAYCGCGTSITVAERLKRNWIGIDITYQSISLILRRLEDSYGKPCLSNIEISGIPEDFESAEALAHKQDDRTRKEFEKWMVLSYSENRAIINEKKGGDKGIDGIAFMKDFKEGGAPVSKEILFSVKSDKMVPPARIRELNGAMQRDGAVMGYLLTLYDFPNLKKDAKQYGTYRNNFLEKELPKIEVISVNEMLQGKKLNIPLISDVLKTAVEKGYKHPELDFK